MRRAPVWVIDAKPDNRTSIVRGTIESYGWTTCVLRPDEIKTTLVGLTPERVVVDASNTTERDAVLEQVEQLRAIETVRHLVVMSNDSFFATQTVAYNFQWIDLPTERDWFQRLADLLGL